MKTGGELREGENLYGILPSSVAQMARTPNKASSDRLMWGVDIANPMRHALMASARHLQELWPAHSRERLFSDNSVDE